MASLSIASTALLLLLLEAGGRYSAASQGCASAPQMLALCWQLSNRAPHKS